MCIDDWLCVYVAVCVVISDSSLFFFFKQKTAYEMRISDWSSDVCSSDLAAEGYARSTGKVGVVLVTSGPGATNAVTGLTDALMDSIPIICLTGQVPMHLIGNDAFQEADTTGITRPCTKHNYLIKSADDVGRVLHEAFYVARSGRQIGRAHV